MAKKFNSREEVQNYVNSLSIQEIIESLSNMLWEKQLESESGNSKIVVSDEQFHFLLSLFKVRGKTETGEIERRGRKKRQTE